MFITRQTFIEPVDGAQTLFTTRQPYLPGSLQLFQGSLLVHPLAYCEIPATRHVRCVEPASRRPWTLPTTLAALIVCAGAPLDPAVALALTADVALPVGLLPKLLYYPVATDDPETYALTLAPGLPPVAFALTQGTYTLAVPLAPLTAQGVLWYNCFVGTDAVPELVGVWEVAAWQVLYDPEQRLSVAQIGALLGRADARVQEFLSPAVYLHVTTTAPPVRLPRYYNRIREVTGDLAYFYAGLFTALRPASSYSESYGGVASFNVSYQGAAQEFFAREEKILRRLTGYTQLPSEVVAGEPGAACVNFADSGNVTNQFGIGRDWLYY